MTHLSPDPPIVDIVTDQRPERKERPASVLAAPRNPVTRWNRKYLLAGAAALAAIVGLGFYLGFGGASASPKKSEDLEAAADTENPQKPEVANRYAGGYADPAVRAAPGTASLPPPGAPGQAPAASSPASPTPVDQARVAAAAQATAARAGSPFFGGAPSQGTPDTGPPSLALLAPPDGAVRPHEAGDVQIQNGQGEKRQFAAGARSEDYLASPLRDAISPWEVKAGTVIPAALITAINSDLPGEVIAQVTEPVYDHATGRTVLIPQGSRLIGQYDSQVAYGQERALIAWNRVIMPNGRSINIGSMSGADLTGASGLRDRVNDHFGQLAKGILLSTLFSVGAASAQDASARSSGGLVINSAGSGVANNAQEVGQRITDRDLGRQPTITVRAGWPLRVLVNKDMILAPYQ
ncbi:MAG TPA: TrbI/VirB10 family protein [Caulobacteraceae bacterium]|nr:TrbI/VirB10 family protein [Caulobacteraceae bacterium]